MMLKIYEWFRFKCNSVGSVLIGIGYEVFKLQDENDERIQK